jgi:allophanate hydrolase
MPLHHQLVASGARLRAATRTAPCYRLYALPGGPPARPGLVRCAGGAAIEVEVYDIPADALGAFVAGIPAPLGLGSVELADASRVTGFICEPYALEQAEDITAWGGWRDYMQAGGIQQQA